MGAEYGLRRILVLDTRWAQQYFNLSGVLGSGQNQVEFLVGFTF